MFFSFYFIFYKINNAEQTFCSIILFVKPYAQVDKTIEKKLDNRLMDTLDAFHFLELKENIRDILSHVCQRQGVASVKKLAYLNAIIGLIGENDEPDYGYRVEEVFCW